VLRVAIIAVALLSASGASAQTFANYRCADGTVMPVIFQGDRANVQLDGKALRLRRKVLSISGARYSANGVTLTVGRKSISLKRKGEKRIACTAE
jgi:membrane-bound inhibitor of C-type lysozyme